MSGSVKIIEVDAGDPIIVTGQGMVSSLGLDASNSCAAARAMLRRAQGLDTLRFASLDGRTVECAIGHPVPIITHGFEGASRLAQLVAAALRDLTSQFSIPSDGRAGLYISMPSCRRHLTGAELIPDPVAKLAFLEESSKALCPADDHIWTGKVLSLARRQVLLPRELPLRFVTYAGHSGFAEALAFAVEHLQTNEVDWALVGGFDSLVDERYLKWLRLTGRLKGESNPTGLEPGECAVFLVAERKDHAVRRHARILSQINRVATAHEDQPRLRGQQPTGRALGNCIRATANAAKLWLITDHNGETSRGMEFGNVLSRVAVPSSQMPPVLFPAAVFGDTSAASGGLAACVVQNAFHRNYAPVSSAVVVSMDDGSQRAAFSIGRSCEA